MGILGQQGLGGVGHGYARAAGGVYILGQQGLGGVGHGYAKSHGSRGSGPCGSGSRQRVWHKLQCLLLQMPMAWSVQLV
jgi:hypothetical protein